MYEPQGLCLNDFDVSFNRTKGCYELIHLQGPPLPNDAYDATTMEVSYGNAFSTDLINWQAAPSCFEILQQADCFDNGAVWTMQTFYTQDNRRAMVYTGVSREHYFRQRIGLAFYDETAEKWQRHGPAPIVEPDPAFYQTEGLMAWRDPYVVREKQEDRYVVFIAAKDNRIDQNRNGCIAVAFSSDLVNWAVQPPLVSPGLYSELECPVPFRKGDYYYLLVSVSDTMRVHVWRAPSLLGEYEEIGFLTDPYHYAARVINHQGQDMVLHTRWVERPSAKTGEMVRSRGYLQNPRQLIQEPDGMLSLAPLKE